MKRTHLRRGPRGVPRLGPGVPGPRRSARTSRSTSPTRRSPRDFWLEAGKQGFLGLEIPEEYGGAGADDYRFNAVLLEELSHVNAALGSCVGHPRRHRRAVPRRADHRGAAQALAARRRQRRAADRDRHDRAVRRLRPRGAEDHRGPDGDDWVINGSKTFITNGYSADLVVVAARTAPEKKARGITLFGVDTTSRRLLPRPQARQGRPGRVRHRRAVLRERPRSPTTTSSASSTTASST